MAKILLGVSGSIAVYKAVDLCSKLVQKGHEVVPLLTKSAREFVQPLSFKYITGKEVPPSHFSQELNLSEDHISLADWAEMFLLAPATANVIAKLAGAIADDTLTTLALALDIHLPHIIAPAMNHRMFSHPLVQRNIGILREIGYKILEPQTGHLACGHTGPGRLREPVDILQKVEEILGSQK